MTHGTLTGRYFTEEIPRCSSVSNWIKYYKTSGSFKAKDNLTDEQKQIRELEKQLKDKQMEIDILKKAMVVMLKT